MTSPHGESREESSLRKETLRRRTFAIISHPDAGKTTITEKLLLYAGCLDVAGMVRGRRNQRAVTSDWMELERKRGISVTSTVLSFEYQGFHINLLDTPGHEDFSEDTYRTLMAADCAVMVLDVTKGVEPQTKKLFKVCVQRKIPIITFVNKLDRPGGDPIGVLGEIEQVLGIGASPLNWPIGEGADFRGLCDRRSRVATVFQPDTTASLMVPSESVPLDDAESSLLTQEERESLQRDLDLLDHAGEPFTRERFLEGTVTPVFFGSALTNYGIEAFLEAFLDLCPSPDMRQEDIRARTEFSGFVFKLQANMDPRHHDQVAFLRVCSGIFTRDMDVTNARTGKKLRLARSHRLFARDRETTDVAYPGDIIGLGHTGDLRLGDTLYVGTPIHFASMPRFELECFARVMCNDTLRRKQFDRGLTQLTQEGAVEVLLNARSTQREPILAAVGRLQFDVVQARLQTEYGVETQLAPLDYHIAREVKGTLRDVEALQLPYSAMVTTAHDGRVIILFKSQWDFDYCKKGNTSVEFVTP
jgi:peptide chain release factor 3